MEVLKTLQSLAKGVEDLTARIKRLEGTRNPPRSHANSKRVPKHVKNSEGGKRGEGDNQWKKSANPDFRKVSKMLYQFTVLSQQEERWDKNGLPTHLASNVTKAYTGLKLTGMDQQTVDTLESAAKWARFDLYKIGMEHLTRRKNEVTQILKDLDPADKIMAGRVAIAFVKRRDKKIKHEDVQKHIDTALALVGSNFKEIERHIRKLEGEVGIEGINPLTGQGEEMDVEELVATVTSVEMSKTSEVTPSVKVSLNKTLLTRRHSLDRQTTDEDDQKDSSVKSIDKSIDNIHPMNPQTWTQLLARWENLTVAQKIKFNECFEGTEEAALTEINTAKLSYNEMWKRLLHYRNAAMTEIRDQRKEGFAFKQLDCDCKKFLEKLKQLNKAETTKRLNEMKGKSAKSQH